MRARVKESGESANVRARRCERKEVRERKKERDREKEREKEKKEWNI